MYSLENAFYNKNIQRNLHDEELKQKKKQLISL